MKIVVRVCCCCMVKRGGGMNLLPRDVTAEQLGLDPVISDKDTVTGYIKVNIAHQENKKETLEGTYC